jgi:hypothetical protein
MSRTLVGFAALALIPLSQLTSVALAEDRPPIVPTRDVDVTYRTTQPDRHGAPRVLEQRMRWAAASGKLRVDPPTPGIYVIMDYRTRRMSTVHEASHQVLEIDAGATVAGPGAEPSVPFVRRGEAQVAGLRCTEWQTLDTAGLPTLACITADGVLLRAISGGRVLVEASSVRYAPQDPVTFQIPAGYTRVTPPPA